MHKQSKPNSIRIIAGQWRGRRLPVQDSPGLRPTTDRVRETVFNWLNAYLHNARCLDLFAGTGALGIESLSRGAKYVQFVETDRKVANGIQASLKLLAANHQPINADIVNSNAIQVINKSVKTPFDIVFLDPPFNASLLEKAASMLEINGWLADEAVIYVEHDARQPSPEIPANWRVSKQATAGQCAYLLFHR